MAAPTIDIGTRLLDGNYSSLNTNLDSGTATDNGTSVTISGVNITSGVSYFVELVFSSTVDCSAAELILITYGGSLRTSAPFSMGLRSGSGNYRVWQNANATTHTNSLEQTAFLNLSETPTNSAGTFDSSAVDGIRMEVTPNRADSNRTLEFVSAWLSDGTVITDGDINNPVSAAEISTSIISLLGATSNVGIPSNSLYRYLFSPQSVTYGASLSDNELDRNGAIVFSGVVESNINHSINNQTVVGFTDLRTGVNIPNVSFIGDTIAFDFLGGFDCDYNITISNAVAIDLNTSRYTGIIEDSDGPIEGGDTVEVRANDITSSATFLWNGVANYSGTRLNSPLADYGFDFGDTFADGATFDASNLTFIAEPLTNKFRLNATGKTLNLSVGTSGITAADVDVVAGTLNIVAPITPISIIGFPDGSTVVVSQSGRQLDLVNNATSPYTYTPIAGQLTTYTFKVVSAGNEDFSTQLNTTESVVAQYIGVPLASQQTLDSEQSRFSELMRVDTAFLRIVGTDTSLNLPLWEIPDWQTEWNTAVVADGPSVAEIAAWVGYLATANYLNISINPTTGEIA